MGCDFVVTAGEVAEVEGDGFDFFFYIGLHFLVTIVDQLGSCRQVRSFEAFSSVRNRHLLHIKSIDISGLSDFLAQNSVSPPFPAVASMQISPSSIYLLKCDGNIL